MVEAIVLSTKYESRNKGQKMILDKKHLLIRKEINKKL